VTGLPLDAVARAQLNILLQPYENIAMFNNVPKIIFPILWLDKTAKLPPEYIIYLKILLAISQKGIYLSTGLMILGVIMITVSYIKMHHTRNSREKNKETQKTYDVLQAVSSLNNNKPIEEHILLEKK
ncbi:hypothetical protein L9F63_005294, partial [Diploptera punctata]